MANSIIIKFQPKGDKELIRAIQSLALAQSRLEKNTKKVKQELERLGARGALATKHLRNVQTSSTGAASAFSVLRSKLLLASFGFTLFAGSVGRFANAAGDAEEIANKFNVVFGDNADAVKNWADAYGDAVGRATTDIMGFAASLQDTFVPLGFARGHAAQLSVQLTKLAVDVASFQNAADADVLNAFQSALVGNHETVRKYGIVITEASLQQEALRSGIVNTNRPLSNQEKVQARLNILIAGSKDAMGDAIETQGSYANQVKRLNSEWKEFSEELGAAIIPVLSKLLGMFTSLLDIMKGNIGRIIAYTAVIVSLGTAFWAVQKAIIAVRMQMLLFKISAVKASGGLALLVFGLGEIAASFMSAEIATDDFKNSVEDTTPEIKTLGDTLRDAGFIEYAAIADNMGSSWRSLTDAMRVTKDLIVELDGDMASLGDQSKELKELRDLEWQLEQIAPKAKNLSDEFDLNTTSVDGMIQSYGNAKSVGEQYNEQKGKELKIFEEVIAANQEKVESDNDILAGVQKMKEAEKELIEVRAKIEDLTEINSKYSDSEERKNALLELQKAINDRLVQANAERILATALLVPNLEKEIEMLDLKNQYSGAELAIEQQLLRLKNEGKDLDDTIIKENGKTELQHYKDLLKAKEDINQATKTQIAWSNKLNSAMMQGINNNARFAEAFGDMLTQMLADMASKAVIFTFLNILTGGGFGGGWSWANFKDYAGGDFQLFHQGGQVQGYSTGGMIPMNTYHSGGGVDNVPIMAQEGEFVMQRSAVESIGVENLNRMNRTGQTSGAVNITFSGNVISDDFIEDVAIPKIKDAIRRGADIGIG